MSYGALNLARGALKGTVSKEIMRLRERIIRALAYITASGVSVWGWWWSYPLVPTNNMFFAPLPARPLKIGRCGLAAVSHATTALGACLVQFLQ